MSEFVADRAKTVGFSVFSPLEHIFILRSVGTRETMRILSRMGIMAVYHYAPLHYLPFIARAQMLLSKSQLHKARFSDLHFRTTSRTQDVLRGFGEYVHLCVDSQPEILSAKLAAGFPHFEIEVPSESIEKLEFHLCRYNIAKTRNLRGARRMPPESPATGRYYGDKALPIAVTEKERLDLIKANKGINMIEVLVPNAVPLTDFCTLNFFCSEDQGVGSSVLKALKVDWPSRIISASGGYRKVKKHSLAVERFVKRSLNESEWRGDGLEFDRV